VQSPAAWGRTRSEIDVLACLRLMVFNRLCDPSSKLGVLRRDFADVLKR
jgi:hypothetical protein